MRPDQQEVDGSSAGELFQQGWQVYRKMVDNNYLFHREAYATLHRALAGGFDGPFRFLDIACGDATASVGALRGTRIAEYHGIDLSRPALELAARALDALDCRHSLEQGDFAEALARRSAPVDVAWVGLSLHHLQASGKLQAMRDIRRFLGSGGIFLAYENAGPDGESRDEWLRRWDRQEPGWSAFTRDELVQVHDHVHGCDYPETDSTWRSLGEDAGFDSTSELYRSPSDLFRLYRFK
ncbi:hypothetical protein C3941_23180 [Kaistia algarum]|uniref:class I SAM-dependent methyltransferase n=1 Tax=Kaistia algarum TaxID=2083279 RepID=UPI000CE829FB|nr:class I SAM-dependent methyltransferase [Kaistia algarum]MCX5513914.1 class I SAM-dependent methyltransferase [Kaistia algarum]PPE77546.1 hypothetical protein C3941_23180 [Kaistia algarum]